MEPKDDAKLSALLREWQVPDAPTSLDERVLGRAKPWWSFLLSGSIRVPAPVALAIAVIVIALAAALLRARAAEPAPAPSSISLVDFRPVKDLNVRVIPDHEN